MGVIGFTVRVMQETTGLVCFQHGVEMLSLDRQRPWDRHGSLLVYLLLILKCDKQFKSYVNLFLYFCFK